MAATTSSESSNHARVSQPEPEPEVTADFSAVDMRLDRFVMEHPAFADHTLETIVLLASTSKMPAVSLLMALDEDDNLDYDIDGLIEDYLPWMGVYPGVTTEHLVSNRSGIPGLFSLLDGTNIVGLCSLIPLGQLQDCAQTIFETPVPGRPPNPPGTVFDYGGGPWQLAGGVAEVVGGASWSQLFDQYIGAPCELEVFTRSGQISNAQAWDHNLDSLVGLDNPNIEGGGATNLSDYAKILSMHLNDGLCGDNQVLSQSAVEFMRMDRSPEMLNSAAAVGYGMGWWVRPADDGGAPTLFDDGGAFGAMSWMDTDRQYAGYVALEDYTLVFAGDGREMVRLELIPLIEEALDAVGQ